MAEMCSKQFCVPIISNSADNNLESYTIGTHGSSDQNTSSSWSRYDIRKATDLSKDICSSSGKYLLTTYSGSMTAPSTRKTISQIRGQRHMPFSKRKWSSLPTISEDELSSFGYNVSQHRSGANSCHSFSRRSPKPKQTKRKTLSVFQRECGNSSFPPSNPSQEITLSLLKDLKLSETRKKSLVASIHRQKPPISSIARTPDLKDSIMAPPHRISSNALIDPSYQLERSAHHLANPQKLLVNMKSEDRFASILLTPTPRSNKSNEGISSLSCARYKTMDSPRIPSRPASPVNFA